MNSLNRELRDGDIVVIAAKYFPQAPVSTGPRLFMVVGSGFGMSPTTAGKAIYGYFVETGEHTRVEGYMLERMANEEEMATINGPAREFDVRARVSVKIVVTARNPAEAARRAHDIPTEQWLTSRGSVGRIRVQEMDPEQWQWDEVIVDE